jgi:ABC-type Fe3+/spermidine/putrescine transport system ATPase subunit
LLLDEPFSNLDAKLREQMRVELKLIQRRLGVTVLFVTHDQIEALSLSDRIAVMQHGRVEQVGTPRELYERPASAFVRDFLGRTVILRGVVKEADAASGMVVVAMEGPLVGSTLRGRSVPGTALAAGAPAQVAIRPEDIEVAPTDLAPGGADGNALVGTIEALLFVGDRYEARVTLGAERQIPLLLSRARPWREGQHLQLVFPPDLVSVWPA